MINFLKKTTRYPFSPPYSSPGGEDPVDYGITYLTTTFSFIGKQKMSHIDYVVKKINKNRDYYLEAERVIRLADKIKHVPWWAIAILHAMEGALNMDRQFLNGQKISQQTTIVPRGMGPWRNWSNACLDAIVHMNHIVPSDFSDINQVGLFFEKWNGFGYRFKGIPSPYLWAYTNHQKPGKYVSDGIFDNKAISLQPGCMAILKALNEKENSYLLHPF